MPSAGADASGGIVPIAARVSESIHAPSFSIAASVSVTMTTFAFGTITA